MPKTDHASGSTLARETSGRHQVLVVGGGFGGVNVAKALAHANGDVTIADRTNHHLFQPLLYQVASGLLSEGLIAPPLRQVIKRQRNARTVQANVTYFDLDKHLVYGVTPDGRRLHRRYDTLVVAGGAPRTELGQDHRGRFAPGAKTPEDAPQVRSHHLPPCELAAQS